MIIRTFLFLFLGALIQGCCSYINVDVDSLSSPLASTKRKYILLPGDEKINPMDLQYKEFEMYTQRVLEDAGFVRGEEPEDAEVIILLTYGITDPKFYNYTYSVPIYGQTGVSSKNTRGTINSYRNGAAYSETTSYTPSYGIIGSTTHVATGVVFGRYLSLVGIDADYFRQTKEIKELWTTRVTSVGESGDLRKIFPILLAAAKEHIASSSGERISVTISEEDKKVLQVKGIMLPQNEKTKHVHYFNEKVKDFLSSFKGKQAEIELE